MYDANIANQAMTKHQLSLKSGNTANCITKKTCSFQVIIIDAPHLTKIIVNNSFLSVNSISQKRPA